MNELDDLEERFSRSEVKISEATPVRLMKACAEVEV